MSYSVYSRYYKSDYCSYMPSVLYIYISTTLDIYTQQDGYIGRANKVIYIRNLG